MAAENSKLIVRRFWDEVLGRGNLDVADELFAPEWVLHGDRELIRMILLPEGPAAVIGLARRLRDYFPDLQVTVEDQVAAEADQVVTRFAISGTNAESESVDVKGMSISQVSGGKIVRTWLYWESALVYEQLGYLPAPELDDVGAWKRPPW
jgi:ketosteroid isomerase-like protein